MAVVLLEGGYASTGIAPIEVFQSAGVLWNGFVGIPAEPCFRVTIASVDGGPVTSKSGLGLMPACAISAIERADIVIVSASGLESQARIVADTDLLPWLRAWRARGALVAGICSGVAFLAEAGLLDGRRATTHWAVAASMRERFPAVRWCADQFVTEDRGVLCSGGIYAAVDLSLYLVEKFFGDEVARSCAKSMLVGMPRGLQTGYAVMPLSRPHDDESIHRIEEYLHENYDRDLTTEMLAGRVGMSPRNFIRRFKAATGLLPGGYVQLLRVTAAKAMLEQGATSIQVVGSRIGYADVAFFRSIFKRHVGMTPAGYRAQFANGRLNEALAG